MRILIAGVGNIFRGDDGFGVEVAQLLAKRTLPEQVRVVDFGIRSFDLAYALLDGYDLTILVDAVSRGERPGTLYTIDVDAQARSGWGEARVDVATHGMDPARVLQMADAMGGRMGRILVVGCEPETLGPEDEGMLGLSSTVMAAVDPAAALVLSLVEEALRTGGRSASGAGAAA